MRSARVPAAPCVTRWLIDHKKAASVLPEPVGAAISVSQPLAMCCQPEACGGVGVPNRWVNQRATNGWNGMSCMNGHVSLTCVGVHPGEKSLAILHPPSNGPGSHGHFIIWQ